MSTPIAKWAALAGVIGAAIGLAVGRQLAGDEEKPPHSSTSTAPVTSTLPPTTRQAASATIAKPADRDVVDAETVVTGTVTALGADDRLWVVVAVGSNYYPQDGPVIVLPDGRWTALTFIGAPTDAGKEFVLYVGSAGPAGTKQFADYLTTGQQTGQFPGIRQADLTDDVRMLSSIVVVRR